MLHHVRRGLVHLACHLSSGATSQLCVQKDDEGRSITGKLIKRHTGRYMPHIHAATLTSQAACSFSAVKQINSSAVRGHRLRGGGIVTSGVTYILIFMISFARILICTNGSWPEVIRGFDITENLLHTTHGGLLSIGAVGIGPFLSHKSLNILPGPGSFTITI